MKAFRRLRVRMLFVCAVGTALVLAAMAVISYNISAVRLRSQFEEGFANSVNAVQSYIREQPVISHTWLLGTEQASGLTIGVQSEQGYNLYSVTSEEKNRLLEQALATAWEQYGFDALAKPAGDWRAKSANFSFEHEDSRYRAVVSNVPLEESWLTLTILRDQAGEDRQIRSLKLGFVAAASGATLFLIIFAWFFSAWAASPAEKSHRRQAEFVAAASHEYRSPVAVIQMAAENIEKAPPETVNRFVEMILHECRRLSRLTQDMLQLAGADNQSHMSYNPEQVNPEAPVLSAYESFQGMAAAKNITLRLELPKVSLHKISCDRERIEQLLAILIDNAIRHTPEGGCIVLGVTIKRRQARFTVADNGPGIPDSQKPHVFERFYRGDSSRQAKDHYGLGLSIAREIADLHKGKLTVEDALEGGCLFTLSIHI